jgi:Na+/phosphate symporter
MLDSVQHEVSDFLGKVRSAHLPLDAPTRARMLLRVADECESVSDEVQALLK